MTKITDELTRRKTLRTDYPLWAATPRITVLADMKPKHRDYDVIIVGAGISGAMMAEALADGKRRILVTDRRLPVRGSTMASTAMIQHEIDIPLHQLEKLIGKEKAMRAWKRSSEAVKHLKRTIARLDIRCAFEERNTLYLAGEEYGSRALKTEAERRHEAGLEAEYLNSNELQERFGIQRTAGIVSSPSASANPAQLTAGLHQAAAVHGVETVSLLDITDLRETRDGVVLATAEGQLLTAADVIFCTGYEFLKVMESPAHQVISTWALASEPRIARPAWLDEFLVWEGSDPYLYFRSTPDGRVIAGGEDEADPVAHLDQDKGKAKFARIAEKLRDLTGIDIGKPAYGWAAAFGTTTTGLPIIDRVPGMDHVHAVMGFGGNGITFSAIASQLVSGRISGKPDPDEDLFRYPD